MNSFWDKIPGLRANKPPIEGALPTKSYDLIKVLDETVPQPQWPNDLDSLVALANPARIYAVIWQAAQRVLVDNLVARVREEIDWYDEVESPADTAPDDGDAEAERDRDLRLGAPPVPMDRP